jgi:hypothetical protein
MAVGLRAIVRRPPDGDDRLTLTAEDGRTVLGTVQVGAEVEITAWRSRGSAPALYRVLIRSEGKEGWTSAANLKSPPSALPQPTTAVLPSSAAAKRPAPKTSRTRHNGARAR